MSKSLRVGGLLFVAAALVGCGGQDPFSSVFQDTWQGPFQVVRSDGSIESSGTMRVEVDRFGRADILLTRQDANPQNQSTFGFMTENDTVEFTWKWNDTSNRVSSGKLRVNGNFLEGTGPNRSIRVNFTGGTSGEMQFRLQRTSTL